MTEKEMNTIWWQLMDDTYQKYYYYNTENKETVWTRPTVGIIVIPEIEEESNETCDSISQEDVQSTSKEARKEEKEEPCPPTPLLSITDPTIIDKDVSSETKMEEPMDIEPVIEETAKVAVETKKELVSATRRSSFSLEAQKIPKPAHTRRKVRTPAKSFSTKEIARKHTLKRNQTIPKELSAEINLFQLESFAKIHFETHKKGILRRHVPVKEMICWTKDVMPNSLTRLTSTDSKEAIKNLKSIQMYCGDRSSKRDPIEIAQEIVDRGINTRVLRDEIYCQLCKQSCFNPSNTSNHKVWELFVLCSFYFPPSRLLDKWLCNYVKENVRHKDKDVNVFARYVSKKLTNIIKNGPRGRVPSHSELERHIKAPFSNSVFGSTLREIMDHQKKTLPHLKIPRIVPVLAKAVEDLGGFEVEGIFRVPGDTEQVCALRVQIENLCYDINESDPSTPASLLKLWMRELEEPIVPLEFYEDCIESCKDDPNTEAAIDVLNRLPEENRLTGLYLISFLQMVARPEYQPKNKMTISNLAMVFAPNFLRCPSEDPSVIFENTKHEKQWLCCLMEVTHDPIDIGTWEET